MPGDPLTDNAQRQLKEIATGLHKMIFDPPLRYPIKSLDLSAGGSVYAAPALMMVFEFIRLCVGAHSQEDDEQGQRTIEYLTRCKRVMQLMLSNHASSLGLHPAVYFYSWTGKQQPILFLTTAQMIVDFERAKRLDDFIRVRGRFEEFLIKNRTLVNQLVRKFGAKDSGGKHLRSFYDVVLELLHSDASIDEVVNLIVQNKAYSYLQPSESPYESVSPRYSAQVKSGVVIRELLGTAARCGICNGLIPSQAISHDHKERLQDGGASTVENAQLTHPYCNTGYKERLRSKGIRIRIASALISGLGDHRIRTP